MLLRALLSFVFASLLGSSTLQAAILNPTGAVTIISPPSDISTGAKESDTTVWAFAERQNVALPSDVSVDISLPGTSPFGGVKNLSPGTIPAGTIVDNYFLHFDAIGQPSSANAVSVLGSISFDSNVLGIVVLSAGLNDTDASLGLPTTIYSNDGGLEIVGGGAGQDANDQITLSLDRRMVTFNFRDANSPDGFRVITSVPEPSTFVLLAFAAFGLACRGFRRLLASAA